MCVCVLVHIWAGRLILWVEEDLFILNIISPRIFYLFICRRERKEEKIERRRKDKKKVSRVNGAETQRARLAQPGQLPFKLASSKVRARYSTT